MSMRQQYHPCNTCIRHVSRRGVFRIPPMQNRTSATLTRPFSTVQLGFVNRANPQPGCHGPVFPQGRRSSLPRLRKGVRLSVKTVRLRRATFEEDIEGFLQTSPREGRFSTAVVVLALWAAIMPL